MIFRFVRSGSLRFTVGLFIVAIGLTGACQPAVAAENGMVTEYKPNFVIVFTDDQGYADVGVFGAKGFKTPNLDQMASEGTRFTDFYVSQAVCSASRVALLTGCYSNRVGILGALGPGSKVGIHADETLLPEVVKPQGYATAIYGKWHLGDREPFLPTRHGFDEYFGLPYSNDMWPFHPTAGNRFPDLPLFENEKIINPKVTAEDQTHLTTWYTEHAVDFIERNQKNPFLLYVPHSMPHVPLHVSEKFKGKSEQGLYGDVIMEIDWSVGEILKTLKRLNLDEKTLVIFTCDNGPWLSYGDHAGSALPLREGKGTMWDGGCREPFIARWPGKIPAGTVCHEMAATIDILPTIARLSGAELPRNKIDGKDIWPMLSDPENAKTPHDIYWFFYGSQLHAIRSGDWKLHFPHPYRSLKGKPGSGGLPGPYIQKETGLELYNLAEDIGETTDVAAAHPDIVKRLQQLATVARDELGDSLSQRKGSEAREPGRVE